MGSIFALLLASLLILAWGDSIYAVTLAPTTKSTWRRRWSISWLLGSCSATWLVFFALRLHIEVRTAVLLVGFCGGGIWVLTHLIHLLSSMTSPNVARGSGQQIDNVRRQFRFTIRSIWGWQGLLWAIIVLQAIQITAAALLVPVYAWDAWVNWMSKALILVRDQTLTPGIYGDPSRLATNLGYPLMLPLLETWYFTWQGSTANVAVGVIALCFFSALLFLFYDSTSQIVNPRSALVFTALLISTPYLEWMAPSGLADIPMACLVLATGTGIYHLMVPESAQGYPNAPRFSSILPIAILAGAMPWLKQEGWLWLSGMTLMLAAIHLPNRHFHAVPRVHLISLVIWLVIAWGLASIWQQFLNGKVTYQFAFHSVTIHNFWLYCDRYPAIVAKFLKQMISPQWNGMWIVGMGIILLRRQKVMKTPGGVLALPLSVFLVGLSFSFIFSRFDPYVAHIQNSIDRLLWQAFPLAIVWIATQYGAWCQEGAAPKKND